MKKFYITTKTNHFLRLLKFGILVIVIALFYFVFSYFKPQQLLTTSEFIKVLKIEKTATKTSLEKTVLNVLNESQNNYSVYIENLKTGEKYTLNSDTQYYTASLYKLWVMAVAFEQIKQEKLTEEEIVSGDISSLNELFNIAPEYAEKTNGTLTYTIDDAIQDMITVSGNYSALLLSNKVGIANISTFLIKNGFKDSSFGSDIDGPTSNANDIALFYKKLYNGEIVDPSYSFKMISILKRQKLKTKIPKYLPANIAIANKTGELDQYSHDSGIIYSKNGDYIIVVLSKSTNPLVAATKIADVSKVVYEYFNENK